MTQITRSNQETAHQTNVTALNFVEEARSWINTRWRHQGRLKKRPPNKETGDRGYLGAVDCVGLLVGVASALKLLPTGFRDDTNYPHNPDGIRLRRTLETFLELYSGPLIPGLVLLFRRASDDFPTHVGIVGDYPSGGLSLIHAFIEPSCVVEHRLDQEWLDLIVTTYKVPGVIY